MHESDILHALRELSTTDLSDALDRLGIAGQCLGILLLSRSFPLVGRAFTIHYVPVSVELGTVGDYIDDLGPDDVVVLDNAGRLDATVCGRPADLDCPPTRGCRNGHRWHLPGH
jgi:4-hydroxy-4-methyl-2-oxoglutarate aldolase